jgi:hypothetical protein
MNKRDQYDMIRRVWDQYRGIIVGVTIAIGAAVFVAVVSLN